MEFKRVRGSSLILFEKITELPLLITGVFISIFLIKNFDTQALVPIVLILFSPVSRLINYLFTFYTLKEDNLLIERGIFTKNRTEIPFSTITTVDLSQNILYQLFKVYKIKVDNASQTNDVANKSNVILALKMDQAIAFKQAITPGREYNESLKEQQLDVIQAQPQDFLKLGLLQSKFAYIFSIIAIVGPVSGAVAPNFKDIFVGSLVIVGIFAIYLLAIVMSVVKSIVTYYNFKIWSADDTLKIQYGLFNKKSFSLKLDKINGIILRQSLLMRLCKLYTVEVIVIGYGDSTGGEETERAIIYPIASFSRIQEIVNKILPEYHLEYKLCRPEPKVLRYFFFSLDFIFIVFVFFAVLITATITGIYLIAICAVIILALFASNVLLRYGNTGISISANNVVMSAGGWNKMMAVIKTNSIESIASSGSIYKRRRGIVSIELRFIAPLRLSSIISRNLPEEQFEILQTVLKY